MRGRPADPRDNTRMAIVFENKTELAMDVGERLQNLSLSSGIGGAGILGESQGDSPNLKGSEFDVAEGPQPPPKAQEAGPIAPLC